MFLSEQANKSNRFAICHPYKNVLGYEDSVASKFTNTKRGALEIRPK